MIYKTVFMYPKTKQKFPKAFDKEKFIKKSFILLFIILPFYFYQKKIVLLYVTRNQQIWRGLCYINISFTAKFFKKIFTFFLVIVYENETECVRKKNMPEATKKLSGGGPNVDSTKQAKTDYLQSTTNVMRENIEVFIYSSTPHFTSFYSSICSSV